MKEDWMSDAEWAKERELMGLAGDVKAEAPGAEEKAVYNLERRAPGRGASARRGDAGGNTVTLYKAVDLTEGEPVQYVGVHAVRWQQEWGMPALGFREAEDIEAVLQAKDEQIERLATAIHDFMLDVPENWPPLVVAGKICLSVTADCLDDFEREYKEATNG